MKLRVYTNSDSSIEREALELSNRVENAGFEVERFDLNDDESRLSAEIYDLYTSPCLVVTQDDGKLIEVWQGNVPTESELFNFLRS